MKRSVANLKKYKQACASIWEEREHICTNCSKYLPTPRAHNFDHINGRLTDENGLDPDNIQILCYKCHSEKHTSMKVTNSEWLDS